MPATYVSIGTVGTGTTTVTAGLPASLATGDGVLLTVVVKPDTATIVTPTDWTLVSNVAGGGGTVGNGTGPQRSATFFREKTGAWSTMPAVAVTGGTSSAAVASRWTKSGAETWDIAAATGVYGTAATTTNAATTMGSNPGITSGDQLALFVTNQSATPTWSAQSFTATGATIGAATERSEAIEFATSPQVGGMLATAAVTAGTATANPVANATASAATRGTSTIVRLRATVVADPSTRTAPAMFAEDATTFDNTTTPKTTAALFSPAVGDALVSIVGDGTSAAADDFAWSNSGTAQTWNEGPIALGTTGSDVALQGAYAISANALSNISVSVARVAGADAFGHAAAHFSGVAGVGNIGGTSGAGGTTPTLSFQTAKNNSSILVLCGDFTASTYATRTWSTVNGAAGVEVYHQDGTNLTVAAAVYTNVGAQGLKTIGMTTPTGTGRWLLYAIELYGPPAGGGATDHALSGSVPSTSTAAGVPAVRVALAGAVAAVSVLAGAVGVSQGLSGQVAGTSTVAGSIGVAQGLAGTAAASFTVSGAPTAQHPLGGTVAATTTATGAPTAHHPLAGTLAATTTVSGSPVLRAPLTGTVAATTTATGTTTSRQGVAGTGNAVSSAAGTFFEAGPQTYPLAGNVVATTTTAGSITARHPLAGTVAAASTAVGAIARAASLAGTVAGTTVVLGNVTATVTLTGQVQATSGTAGAIQGTGPPPPTPPERTLSVQGESRVIVARIQTRTLGVTAESRTLRVPAENRTVEA